MFFTAVLSWLLLKIYKVQRKSTSWKQWGALVAFSTLFSANIVVGNLAIQKTSLGLVQIIRSTIPGNLSLNTKMAFNDA